MLIMMSKYINDDLGIKSTYIIKVGISSSTGTSRNRCISVGKTEWIFFAKRCLPVRLNFELKGL
jgi:hypothetical protein